MLRLLIVVLSLSLAFNGLGQNLIKARSAEGAYSITRAKPDSLQSSDLTERRFALLIGNKSYKQAPLENPVNDANDLSALLKLKKFNVVTVIDGTRLEMRAAIHSFAEEIAKGGVGLFYYSGHGVQVEGENYLVPIDADYQFKEEVPQDCIGVSSILRFMESSNNNSLNILILDACRNSSFKTFSRSGEKGILGVEAPKGSIVAYSTAPGKTASDGTGRNGLYTSKLIKYLNVPGMKIEEIFKSVRIDVMKESHESQIPWESNSLMGDFYFTKN